jgi:hypothetical protein
VLKAASGRIKRLSALLAVECRRSWLLKMPAKRRSGLFVDLMLALQEELLDCSPVVCDVGLAIQLGVCELGGGDPSQIVG